MKPLQIAPFRLRFAQKSVPFKLATGRAHSNIFSTNFHRLEQNLLWITLENHDLPIGQPCIYTSYGTKFARLFDTDLSRVLSNFFTLFTVTWRIESSVTSHIQRCSLNFSKKYQIFWTSIFVNSILVLLVGVNGLICNPNILFKYCRGFNYRSNQIRISHIKHHLEQYLHNKI